MVLIGAVTGAAVAAGLVVVALGVRGSAPVESPQRLTQRLRGRRGPTRAATAVAAAIGMFALTGWPVGALLAAVVAVVVPEALRRARAEADVVNRTSAVAAWTEMLRDTLAAAAGLEEALVTTAGSAPEAIRPEVQRLSRRLQHGRLVGALEQFAAEVSNPAADLVVAALVTAARREARELVPLLSALARSARSGAEMRLRVHVSRARIRTAVRVVVGTLALFGGGLVVFNRAYLEPYGTAEGQVVLLLVGGVFAIGWALLQRMAHIEAPERFLTRTRPGGEGAP